MAARTILFLLALAAPKEKTLAPAPTSTTAQRVFDRLVAELPPHLQPDGVHYRLTVLDLPGDHAQAAGDGFVRITRPMMNRLLADKERGDAALAFVLADEIAHVALGHCARIAAEKDALASLVSYLPFPLPHPQWSFTDADRQDADRFALHLCRNAGFDLDAALGSLRLEGDAGRLKRMLMERDGLFDDQTRYGLFLFDRRSGKLNRCGPRQIGPDERPIVLVHGLRGNEWRWAPLFPRRREEVADRPLLVFRYPNNESLSRCGEFLMHETGRVMVAPEKAVFVCYGAGGLVFRWYAEVRHGGFDKAIFLAVPQAGTRMADLKGFVDVGRFLSTCLRASTMR